MIGFLIRKNFYDLWDNLFRIVMLNLGFVLSTVAATIPFFFPSLFSETSVIATVFMFAGTIWCFIYLSAASLCIKQISDNGKFGFSDFFEGIKKGWPWGIAAGALVILCVYLILEVIPFYVQRTGPLFGMFLAAFIISVTIGGIFAFQFFFTVLARLDKPARADKRFLKILKKCVLIYFDNSGFCIFAFFNNLIMFLISFLTAFLFPGPAGILLFLDEGLRLRLLKYDWLEANPDKNRKKIPWDILLIEEREKTGTRSLKNLIFPWKD